MTRSDYLVNLSNPSIRFAEQLEIKRAVNESQKIMDDERTELMESHKRRATQRSTLDVMGLNEVEALEYALMISRDEQEARREMEVIVDTEGRLRTPLLHEVEEDVSSSSLHRQGRPIPIAIPAPSTKTGRRRSPPLSSAASFGSSHHSNPDNSKVQVSPRSELEPTEAGFSASPRHGSSWRASSASRTFNDSTSVAWLSPTASMFAPSALPPNPRTPPGSAWSRPRPLSVVTPPSSSPPVSRIAGPSLLSTSLARHGGPSELAHEVDEELDDDLKYAIDLSLAEARSRAE